MVVLSKIYTRTGDTGQTALGNGDRVPRPRSPSASAAANTPAEFATYIRQEIAKWAKLVKETGAKVD